MRKPWKRKGRGWFVTVQGPNGLEQIPLGKDKEAAFIAYHELMAKRANEPAAAATGALLVVQVLDDYLADLQATQKQTHYQTNKQRLQSFVDYLEAQGLKRTLTVNDLKPFHVTEWANSHKDDWSQTSRRGRMGVVKRAFNWAEESGKIERSPISKMKMPAAQRRDRYLTPEQYAQLLGKVKVPEFKNLLVLAWETGARPQELLRVEARHYENGTWVFPDSEGKGDKFRRVFLSATAKKLVENLNQQWPTGPILRNTEGNPWNPFSINCHFVRLKEKIGRKLNLGCLRHSFATRALKTNDPITVSMLLGHSDVSMLAKVYQHLNQDADYLRAAAEKVNSGGQDRAAADA